MTNFCSLYQQGMFALDFPGLNLSPRLRFSRTQDTLSLFSSLTIFVSHLFHMIIRFKILPAWNACHDNPAPVFLETTFS